MEAGPERTHRRVHRRTSRSSDRYRSPIRQGRPRTPFARGRCRRSRPPRPRCRCWTRRTLRRTTCPYSSGLVRTVRPPDCNLARNHPRSRHWRQGSCRRANAGPKSPALRTLGSITSAALSRANLTMTTTSERSTSWSSKTTSTWPEAWKRRSARSGSVALWPGAGQPGCGRQPAVIMTWSCWTSCCRARAVLKLAARLRKRNPFHPDPGLDGKAGEWDKAEMLDSGTDAGTLRSPPSSQRNAVQKQEINRCRQR